MAALACRLMAGGLVASALLSSFVLIGLPHLGHPLVIITGRSMTPSIPRGSLVVLDSLPAGGPGPGDVVTFSADNGTLVTHRVTRVVIHDGQRYVETRGDANAQADPALVPESRLSGRLALAVPVAGYVISVMSRPQGWLTFLAMLVFLWIASGLLNELTWRRPAGRGLKPRAGYRPSPWAPS